MTHEHRISKKKKKTIIYWIVGSLLIIASIIGTVYYFSQKDNKKPSEKQEKEQKSVDIQQLQTELNSVKSELNKSIKKLEQEIKKVKEKLKNNNPDNSEPPPENPDPNQNKPIEYVATKINDNTFKYHFVIAERSREKLTWNSVILFLKEKYKTFFKQAFQGALKDANSKFPAYFWECPPVSQKNLDKPFEFVVIRSDSLNNMTQDHKPYEDYLADAFLQNKYAISFPNKPASGQPSDAILVIPSREFGKNPNKYNDYKNITQFTKNAPDKQQQELWKEVTEKLSEELAKGDRPRWLSTHGGGVAYLHVRIDEKPKYYSHEEYRK